MTKLRATGLALRGLTGRRCLAVSHTKAADDQFAERYADDGRGVVLDAR